MTQLVKSKDEPEKKFAHNHSKDEKLIIQWSWIVQVHYVVSI